MITIRDVADLPQGYMVQETRGMTRNVPWSESFNNQTGQYVRVIFAHALSIN